jgi:hypothetical protein
MEEELRNVLLVLGECSRIAIDALNLGDDERVEAYEVANCGSWAQAGWCGI